MKYWTALEWVILLLTIMIVVTIAGSWLVGLTRGTVLDDARVKIVETIYNNAMGAILLYAGAKLQQNKER